jgi:hypothetical protein
MSGSLKRAKLVPYDSGGKTLQNDKTIKFDFNPETLTLKVSTGQQQDKSRRGRQQVQSVGASSATLSFDAIFDTTRPKDHDNVADTGDLNDDSAMDVRQRTKPIADLLAAVPTAGGGSGGSGGSKTEKAPSRVQFQWGNILFDGVITSHQEVFDYFAPSGVPLRSKVSLTLTEQNFVYTVNADDVARATATPSPSTARDLATANNDDSLFELGPGGLSLGFSANLSLGVSLDASASFSAQLGISADLGVSLDAGISLDASAALDVFGSAALNIGGGDVGQAGLSSFAPTPKPPPGVTPPASPWAPDGPAPGSSAAQLASAVNASRAGGAAVAPAGGPGAPASTTPAPVRGSPPPALPRAPITSSTVYAASRLTPQETIGGFNLPSWQTLPGDVASSAIPVMAVAARHRGGCGCRACRGH